MPTIDAANRVEADDYDKSAEPITSPRLSEDTPELDGLLSLLRVAPWIYDPRRNTITWQRTFAETPDRIRPQTTERLIDIVARYREEERPALLRHYELALREGHSGPVRFTVFNRAGEPTHIESAAVRCESSSGEPLVRGVFRKCSDDASPQEALDEALFLLGRVTSISPSSIILLDAEGIIRSANAQFLATFHIATEKGFLGRHIRTVANVLGKSLVATMTMLLENDKETVKAQQRFLLPDNTSVTMNFRSQRIGDNGGRKGLMFAGEPANVESVNFGALFNRMPTPMMAVAVAENTIVAANLAARRTFGLRGDHIGREAITKILMKDADFSQIQRDLEIHGPISGFVCPARSLMGGGENYRVKAMAFVDEGQRYIALEFHETNSQAAKAAATAYPPRKGLLSRVVDHLDF